VMARLLPWSAAGLVVMLVSGALLFYAAPVLGYHNLFFRFKMVALALAIINAWRFHRRIYRRVTEWDRDPVPPAVARMAGGISLILWAAIITAGRMMPYQIYWFD
jgi:O-antigen/teichoic acid export membrane protein